MLGERPSSAVDAWFSISSHSKNCPSLQQRPAPTQALEPMTISDPATCSALDQFQMRHLALSMDVEMARKTIAATATLTIHRVGYGIVPSRSLQLDVFHLRILSVEVRVAGAQDGSYEPEPSVPASWEIRPFTSFGEVLGIELSVDFDAVSEFQVIVRYETEHESPAVCWLEKEQTAGKQHPFMYTQGQEVLNRSFFPCQDSPSVRTTYEAAIRVPSMLACVMSAKLCSSGPVVAADGSDDPNRKEFRFVMNQSIPVYLVAMAVGDLAAVTVGPRSSVWTEPCMLEACKKEFTGVLEQYLSIGERLFGEYQWERYDLLVMPPSFPYGGMENPRLTFISPSIVAGDQSLLSTVAHEIAHSWFGNLVTNASWSDFFLNEGFTMYAERRITGEAHGRPFACLHAKIGEALLREEIGSLGEDDPLTRLRVPLEMGIDPGDCYNHCAYEKGFAFVCYLRSLVGTDEAFDRFLKDYANHFRFQSIPAEEMMTFFVNYFPHLSAGNDLRGPIKFSTWLHQPGYPPYTPDLVDAKDMMEASETLAYYWASSEMAVQSNVLYLSNEAKQWPVLQLLYFLDCCFDASFHDSSIVIQLGDALDLWNSSNAEVQFRWCQVLIKNQVEGRVEIVRSFLTNQGKQKFLIPIYRLLTSSSSHTMRQLARTMYDVTKQTLHVMVRDRVEVLLSTAN